MRRPRALLVVVVVVVATGAFAAGASARWTSSASGAGTAKAASLSPPSSLASSCGPLLQASVKLTWSAAPDAWTGGYEVRWGTSSGVYTTTAAVTAPTVTYTTPALGTGTYYFSVVATSGAWRSAATGEVSRTILLGACV